MNKCKYCQEINGKILTSDANRIHAQIIKFNNGKFYIDLTYYGFNEDANNDFEINYCPICGEELNKRR